MMLNKLKEGLAGQSLEKAQDVIREFNDTVPKLKAIGLSVSVGFKGVAIDVKLGLLPSVEINLLN